MRYMERVIFGCLMLCGFVPGALACTTASWNGGASGAFVAASPPTVARYSESCALSLTGQGHVQDNSPAHTQMIFRFYVLPQLTGSGTAKIFAAYSAENGTGELFDITWNGTNFSFNPTSGTSQTFPAPSGWSLIEVSYSAGGSSSFWVNANAATDPISGSFTAASGTIQSVRVGLPDGLGGYSGGNVNFDAYESHATTPVGPLLAGDANASDSVNVFDMVAQQNEILGSALAPGQPDCNSSGSVNVFDMVCVQNIILGN